MSTIRTPDGSLVFPFFRGRAALYHLLTTLGIGEGDEVAIQAFTCLAVPLPILELGARPLFIDANARDLGMSVEDLRRKISPRTRAIVVQHTFGIPADIFRLRELADEAGAVLIEDCAHVIGGNVGGRELGSLGIAAFYSYEWGKPLVAGVGGGLVVNDPRLRKRFSCYENRLLTPPLTQRVLLAAQYYAYRWLLTGRTYWTIRTLYNVLSRWGLVVGTFRREDMLGGDNPEYQWGMAPGTAHRLERKLERVETIRSAMRNLTVGFEERLQAADLPVWPVAEDREAIFMRYPFLTHDKGRFLRLAREQHVEFSGMFETPVDPIEMADLGRLGYELGSCPVAERLSDGVVSVPINVRISPVQHSRTIRFLAGHKALLKHGVADDLDSPRPEEAGNS